MLSKQQLQGAARLQGFSDSSGFQLSLQDFGLYATFRYDTKTINVYFTVLLAFVPFLERFVRQTLNLAGYGISEKS